MMSLFDELTRISRLVESQFSLMKNNEEATISVSVSPFIRALGYITHDLNEVYPQHTILNIDAVDFAILRAGEPIMFLEAKKAGEKLSTKHWKQLFQYFNAGTARIGILTNGIEYRFYTDLKKRNIMDKQPFLAIDMLALDKRSVEALENFTKPRFDIRRIVDFAQRQKLYHLLQQEMDNPSDALVDHFASNLQHGRMSASARQRYRDILRAAWRELVEMTRPPDNGEADFIPVFGNYQGHRLEAELLRKSVENGLTIMGKQIRYKGKITWPKDAAVKAILSIDPSFQPTKTHINSFTFWHVVDPADSTEHMIRYISGWDQTNEELRQRVLQHSYSL